MRLALLYTSELGKLRLLRRAQQGTPFTALVLGRYTYRQISCELKAHLLFLAGEKKGGKKKRPASPSRYAAERLLMDAPQLLLPQQRPII